MKTLFNYCLYELRRILHDEGALIFMLLVPLGYPILYTFIYTDEVVRQVPAVAVNLSDSSMGREFLRQVDASPDVDIILETGSMDEAKKMLRAQEAYGIIYLPGDFNKRLQRGEQAHVSLFCDMSGLLYYKALAVTCTDVSLKMNGNIRLQMMPGLTVRQEEVTSLPVKYESIAAFNPQTGFASFLIPAVLVLIIQQTLLLGTGLLAGTDRDRGLFPYRESTVRMWGKGLACLLLYLPTSAYMLIVVPHLFHLPQLAHASTLALFMVPYLLACLFLALTMEVFIPNREASMLVFVCTSVPLLFLSGISWPGSDIPMGWKLFSYLYPSTFGINGFVRINTMGASLADVQTEFIALWIQAITYYTTAWGVRKYGNYLLHRSA